MREDFTGKLAGMITPYIKETLRECEEVADKQDELEKKFEQHRKAVAESAAQMEASFVKMRKEAAKDWKAQRDQIQEDFVRVDDFVKWFRPELEKNGKKLDDAVMSCNLAVRACNEVSLKMGEPVERAVKLLDEVRAQGEADINRAAKRLTATYDSLRRPFMWGIMALVTCVVILHLGLGSLVLWRIRTDINTNWKELAEQSEQQKQEMKGLLDKAMDEAKESQIDREVKVKMWDEMIKTLTPQQRTDLINKLRWQVNKEGEKRLEDQMSSSYDQMDGKK